MTRLGLLNFGLRHVARPFLARTKTPELAKRDFDRAARFIFRKPANLSLTHQSIDGADGPLLLAKITCGAPDTNNAILYFHGGGYVAGSPETHRGMLGQLSKLSRLPVFSPDYRLAQAAPFPAAFEDAYASWNALISMGYRPNQIILGGDSAGGGLALTLLAQLLSAGVRPGGLFAFSPWTDLTLTGASLVENERSDAILPRARMGELVETIMGEGDRADPRISPLFAAWKPPPPVYIQASKTEILRDDAVRMAEKLRAAGGDVTLDLWEDAPHVWQIFDGWVPEARDALARTAEFCARCFSSQESES